MHDDALWLMHGVQGVTDDTAGSSESGFTFNDVMTMLIVDIFVYAVLAWYATNVRSCNVLVHMNMVYRCGVYVANICHTLARPAGLP